MRLYCDLAALWPLLSPPEDYESEAAMLHQWIQQHFDSSQRIRVLELGAGGGHTLVHLAEHYDCTAVDFSETMLEQCQKLIPCVKTHIGDMRDVRLHEIFDVVLIHDAIDYMLSPEDIAVTLETVKAHLAPGGVAFIAPTYFAETFENHAIESDSNGDPETGRVLAYTSYVHREDDGATTFEMILVYVINDDGQVQVIEDRHTCGLFSEAHWDHMLRDVGFDTERVTLSDDDQDMPFNMFVCTRSSTN